MQGRDSKRGGNTESSVPELSAPILAIYRACLGEALPSRVECG